MTATGAGASRAAALALLGLVVAGFVAGPVAGYCALVGANRDALAEKSALLQRYRALATNPSATNPSAGTPLAGNRPEAAVSEAAPLIYPAMPEAQAAALLQETVKTIAAAAKIQVQGIQVLRSDSVAGATRIGVRVRATGDTASLRALIYAIETASPLLYPDNLQIQSHAGAAEAGLRPLDVQLDIAAFKAEPAS